MVVVAAKEQVAVAEAVPVGRETQAAPPQVLDRPPRVTWSGWLGLMRWEVNTRAVRGQTGWSTRE